MQRIKKCKEVLCSHGGCVVGGGDWVLPLGDTAAWVGLPSGVNTVAIGTPDTSMSVLM